MITKDQLTAIIMTLVVWGLAGGLFGALFTGLHLALIVHGLNRWEASVAAAAAAAMTTSAFYRDMPVALTGAMAGVLASIASLILYGHEPGFMRIAGTAAVIGLGAGSFFAWVTGGRGQPLAHTAAGLLGGAIAGGLVVVALTVTKDEVGGVVLAAGVVAVVGTLFQISERWLKGRKAELLHPAVSTAIVSALIAFVVAGCFWLLGDTPTAAADGTSHDLLGQIRRELPTGFLGGVLGGAVTGILLELLGFRLEEHD